MGWLNDKLFGSTGREDLLTGDQKKTLNTYGAAGRDAVSRMGSISNAPRNAYSTLANWENEFQSGVVQPATNRLNSDLANLSHSNERHSGANKKMRNQTVQNFNDNLAGQRYNMLLSERDKQMQGLENAYGRQENMLSQLGNYGAGSLNTRAFEFTKNPGLLDQIGGAASGIAGIGTVYETIFGGNGKGKNRGQGGN